MKKRYLLILLIIISIIGFVGHYMLERKAAYPYPKMYEGIKEECPSLLKGSEYKNKTSRDHGINISGITYVEMNGEKQTVKIQNIRNQVFVMILRDGYNKDNLEIKDIQSDYGFDIHDNKFKESNLGLPAPNADFKAAFEKEMIERLKSCEK
ncbi:MAG: hypothetical protein ACRC34_00525 [Cetobacterium sp.]